MYAAALSLSAATTVATTGLPFFQWGSLGPIQSFGVIVAAGVLIGAALLRRYAEWHGVEDRHIRHLLGWVTVCGFLGAHEFDMIAYNWAKIGHAVTDVPPGWWPLGETLYPPNWPLPLKIWEGISSYGGFLGGAMGFAFYVWWKRLPVRLFADITIVGLLPAFSIGRIGCTVVSDHIGARVNPDAWYSFLAMDYPSTLNMEAIHALKLLHPNPGPTITAWNLGLIEVLYLLPVNALILYLAFRPAKPDGDDRWLGRTPAGFLTVLTGVLYAPVRFFLEFLRIDKSDPRHLGLTFAQWCSILAFGVAMYAAWRIWKNGEPATPVTRTSRDTQERLRIMLKEEDEEATKQDKARSRDQERKPLPKAIATDANTTADDEPATGGEDDDDASDASEDEDAASRPAAKRTFTPPSNKPKAKPKKKKGRR